MHSFSPLVAPVLLDDRLRSAERHARAASAAPLRAVPAPAEPAVTIRRASSADAAALRALADLDSAAPLAGSVLLAESGGAPLAAISLADGRVVADPFVPTLAVQQLLRTRATQLAAPARRFAAHRPLRALRFS